MSEIKLLPCPFCGGEAELLSDSSSTVQCRNDQCIVGSEAPFNDFSHQWDAIAAWNRRAIPAAPALGALLEQAREEGRREGREACAQLADAKAEEYKAERLRLQLGREEGGAYFLWGEQTANSIARTIRARTPTTGGQADG